jgi:Putative beta-barrel porin 2
VWKTPVRSPIAGSSCRTGARGIRNRRSARLCVAAAALAAFVVVGASTPVRGQAGKPDSTVAQSSLSPTVRLTLGSDDNVFRVNEADRPIADFVTTVSPAAQGTLVVSRLKVSGQGEVDFINFRKVTQINSVDSLGAGRVELLLWRLTPYVGGDWSNTRHRRNFEIDLPVRQVDSSWRAGVDLRLSGKTTVGVSRRRSRVDYEGDTSYLGTDLAQYLGATAAVTGVDFRYALTPFTTVGADVEQDRTEFKSVTERNSDGFLVASVVEFRPRALVSGRVRLGIRRRTFVDGNVPPFRTVVANFDLAYTLLGRTRFNLGGQRDLSYSYRVDQRDYLPSGIELTVSHRVANAWEVVGALGGFRLHYGLGVPNGPLSSRSEKGLTYRLGVGYHLRKTIVGIEVSRETRTSDFSVNRDYEATRIASSVSYGF